MAETSGIDSIANEDLKLFNCEKYLYALGTAHALIVVSYNG